MAEQSAETRMNTAALKRADPYLKELLETAAHVALYTFNADVNEWEKTEVEGALFVYSRTGEPFHNILIMNRLNSNNFVEPIIRGLDLHLEDPYLLYRTVRGAIYCIWFYDKGECGRIGQTLAKLVRETVGSTIAKKAGNSRDLFSMLSKAQEEYNSAATNVKDTNGNKPDDDNTPKSVKDFFMKASSSSAWTTAQQNPPEILMRGPTRPPPPGMDPLPPHKSPFMMFGKLVLDPKNSLHNIEKQQQTVAAPPPQQIGPKKGPKLETGPRLSSEATKSVVAANNGDLSPSPTISVQTLNFFNSSLTKSFQKLDEPKPMPPQPAMFTNSKITPPKVPQQQPPAIFTNSKITPQLQPTPKIEPLTKTQLLRAIEYLLKNDPEFVHKLHEAYVKSLAG